MFIKCVSINLTPLCLWRTIDTKSQRTIDLKGQKRTIDLKGQKRTIDLKGPKFKLCLQIVLRERRMQNIYCNRLIALSCLDCRMVLTSLLCVVADFFPMPTHAEP